MTARQWIGLALMLLFCCYGSVGQQQAGNRTYPISTYDLCVGLALAIQGITVLGIGLSHIRRKYKLRQQAPRTSDRREPDGRD